MSNIKVIVDRDEMVAIADAVRNKMGESIEYNVFDIATGINNIGLSNENIPINDVTFYDYDGTVLYSYSKEEALALTSMPALPEHNGLISQDWNWSLEDMVANVQNCGKCNIGALYMTNDGKTRIYITLQEGRTSPMLGCCPNGEVMIDWGDGTEPVTLTGNRTSKVQWTPTHEYSSSGDYVITLDVIDGELGLYGSSATNCWSGILRHSSSADVKNIHYMNDVRKIELGNNVTYFNGNAFRGCRSLSTITFPNSSINLGGSVFQNCNNLKSVVFPNGVTNLGSSMFYYCNSLSNVSIPSSIQYLSTSTFYGCNTLSNVVLPYIDINNVVKDSLLQDCWNISEITIPYGATKISSNAFIRCYKLSNVVIPETITEIGTYAFNECYNITNVNIPNSVLSIGHYSFGDCYGLAKIRFNSTTPPTIQSTSFNKLPADCIISVPTGCLSAYTSATNYPSSTSYTYIEED